MSEMGEKDTTEREHVVSVLEGMGYGIFDKTILDKKKEIGLADILDDGRVHIHSYNKSYFRQGINQYIIKLKVGLRHDLNKAKILYDESGKAEVRVELVSQKSEIDEILDLLN